MMAHAENEPSAETILRAITAGRQSKGKNLSELRAARLDLSSDALERHREEIAASRMRGSSARSLRDLKRSPPWYSDRTGGLDLSGMNLARSCFDDSKVWRSDFMEADLEDAKLRRADLGVVDFTGARLVRTDFSGSVLARSIFRCATIDAASFRGCDLRDADFTDATIASMCLSGAQLGNTRIDRNQIAGRIKEELQHDYDGAVSAYAALKVNFRQIGRFEDASWAYLRERTAETRSRSPRRGASLLKSEWQAAKGPKKLRAVTHFMWRCLQWIGGLAIGVVSGYGEKPMRAFLWIPIIAVTFASFFHLTGGIVTSNNVPAAFVRSLEYSFASIVTMSTADLGPRNGLMQFLTNLEALLGVSLLSLVMFSLGKRITRS